jgi:hypothetical protein
MEKPMSFKKLLACTDNSADSRAAVAAALELARLTGGKVYLLQTVTWVTGYELQSPDMPLPWPQIDLEMLNRLKASVQASLAETWGPAAQQAGVELEIRVPESAVPHAGILETAQEIRPDLIVMGRHGRTGLARLLMGSVTARIIGHSPFPVLVAPPNTRLNFQRIMVGSDGSPDSAVAWDAALDLNKQFGAYLLAVSVARSEPEESRAKEIVREMADAAQKQGMVAETMVLTGPPYETLAKAAGYKEASLIILGSHGRTGLSRLLMGSVTERVIGLAPCPVLVVKR